LKRIEMTTDSSKTEKEWTWQEISEHSTRKSIWLYVGRDVYDVTNWLTKHPGGEELLLLFAGRDCTESFRAYHPFTEKPFAILEKFKIGRLKGPTELVRFKEDTGFYKTVRERCGKYFKDNNIDPIKQTPLHEFFRFFSTVGMFVLWPYIIMKLLVDWGVPFWYRLPLVIPAAFAGVMLSVDVAHMASHCPTFHSPKLNTFIQWLSFDFCFGMSWTMWLHEHVVGHHQYVNIITIDPNCPENYNDDALYRSSPNQKWYKRFYYQFIWLPVISCLLATEYRMASFRYWFKGYRKEIRVNSEFLTPKIFFFFMLGKILFVLRSYIIPVVWWGCPFSHVMVIMTLIEMLSGYTVGISFPANHITDKVDWPVIRKDEKTGENVIDSEWAIMQLRTCKDYSYESWFFTNVFGSLNNHSCHHLFPAMHHSYYQHLSPIIKQTAKEYGVILPDVPSYWHLVYDYIHNLWSMGFEPKEKIF